MTKFTSFERFRAAVLGHSIGIDKFNYAECTQLLSHLDQRLDDLYHLRSVSTPLNRSESLSLCSVDNAANNLIIALYTLLPGLDIHDIPIAAELLGDIEKVNKEKKRG